MTHHLNKFTKIETLRDNSVLLFQSGYSVLENGQFKPRTSIIIFTGEEFMTMVRTIAAEEEERNRPAWTWADTFLVALMLGSLFADYVSLQMVLGGR